MDQSHYGKSSQLQLPADDFEREMEGLACAVCKYDAKYFLSIKFFSVTFLLSFSRHQQCKVNRKSETSHENYCASYYKKSYQIISAWLSIKRLQDRQTRFD